MVIGEPTNLHLARGQRGRIEFRITIKGRSAHASAPERGVNAIYGAARAIVGLELLSQQLAQDSFLGKGSIAVTEIASTSGSRNAVPDSCTIYVDRRASPWGDRGQGFGKLRRALSREAYTTIAVSMDGISYSGQSSTTRQVFPYWIPRQRPAAYPATAHIEDALGSRPRGVLGVLHGWCYTGGGGHSHHGFGPAKSAMPHR